MTDTTHDIDALVKKANAITRHPSMGGAISHAQDVLGDMSAALTALQKERDVAISKVDFYEQKDGMDGAVVHAIREMLYAHNVPKAAFIDDHVANVIVQRDAALARAEAAEAAVPRAYERGRDDAAERVWSAHDSKDADYWGASISDITRREKAAIIRDMPLPADLARGAADDRN